MSCRFSRGIDRFRNRRRSFATPENCRRFVTSMKTTQEELTEAVDRQTPFPAKSRETLSRRDFLAASAAVGASLVPGALSAAPSGKQTFTILHTNDIHSNLIGLGPASDYTPFKLNDDRTRGGLAR